MDPTYLRNIASNLIQFVEKLRNLMIAVSTGDIRIQAVADEYARNRRELSGFLKTLELEDPNPYNDLWEWYGKWKSGDLPTWASRRLFIREMYAPLIAQLENISRGIFTTNVLQPTGWVRIDRVIDKMRLQLSEASDEEDFQAIGLLAREVLISLGQAVYNPKKHNPGNDKELSSTDAAGMLERYISVELSGKPNEELRSYAKAALKLALALQHDRKADFRDAALSADATSSVVNIIAIVSGRRDPNKD